MQALEFEAGYSRQGNPTPAIPRTPTTRRPGKRELRQRDQPSVSQHLLGYLERRLGQRVTNSNWAQYERTRNSRKGEGLAGGTEGIFNSNQFTDIDLADVMLHSEVSIPFDYLVNQNLTLGSEWNQQRMKDNASNTQALSGGEIHGLRSTGRSPYSQAEIFSLFAENNMELTDTTMLTPALRFDHHSIVGNNWSPSLNLSQGLWMTSR